MTTITVGRTRLEVSNLDKVLYPATGFTKGEVIAYYQAIAPVMLPHLARRPVTVKRYPDGVDGLSFYEKRCPLKRPTWVHDSTVTSSTHGSLTFCVIDNAPTLVWMANRAALEYHTYLYRDGHEDEPTMLVFDLDPGAPATLSDCLDIAVVVRDLLHELGLQVFAKTSGGKGLHLGVPLRGATFSQVKTFARAVAELLAREEPKRVTSRMAKSERGGRVLIDWSQNDHGKTTACAYTLRARQRPTVSTPVSWEEIDEARRKRKTERLEFETSDVLARVADLGDLFAPTLTVRQRLPRQVPQHAAR
jgi:bifunctional non-homologous end joining protein LigD